MLIGYGSREKIFKLIHHVPVYIRRVFIYKMIIKIKAFIEKYKEKNPIFNNTNYWTYRRRSYLIRHLTYTR